MTEKKSNLVGVLFRDLIRFSDSLTAAFYFLSDRRVWKIERMCTEIGGVWRDGTWVSAISMRHRGAGGVWFLLHFYLS